MLDAWQDLPLRGTVAGEFIGDDHPRHGLAALEQLGRPLGQELLSRLFVAAALHEDIQHGSLLVDRSPEVGGFTVDGQKNLIKVPLVARTRPPAPELIGVLLAELKRPTANGFIAEHDTPNCQKFFNISKTQRKPIVQPYGMADNFGRVTVTLVGGDNSALHAESIAYVGPISDDHRFT